MDLTPEQQAIQDRIDRRERIAQRVLVGLVANAFRERTTNPHRDEYAISFSTMQQCAREACDAADALVAELDRRARA